MPPLLKLVKNLVTGAALASASLSSFSNGGGGVHAQTEQTRTAFEFSRAIDTCDVDDIALEGTTRVIYSWNDNIPADELSPEYHGAEQRGSSSINLVGSNPVFEVAEDDIEQFDLRLTEHTIAANGAFGSTLYWCEIFAIPADKAYHVVQFDMQVNPDNFVNVHHAVMYECPEGEGSEGQAGVCPSSGGDFGDDDINACEGGNVVWAWAIGGNNNTLPPDVGFPVGLNGVSYVMLEMHYDLPNLESITDDSGVVFHVTPTLRPIESGILAAGVVVDPDFLRVPPGESAYVQDGWCPGACLGESIRGDTDEQKITLFSGFLHAHLAGRAITARHVRNGTELEPILVDNAYDFNYQQYQWFFERRRDVLPGDDILIQCTYNTEDRTEDTVGGIATHQEMCLAYFMYYPRLPGSLCWSGDLGDDPQFGGGDIAACPGTGETLFLPDGLPVITEEFVEVDNCPSNSSVPTPNTAGTDVDMVPRALEFSSDADVVAWRQSFDNSATLHDGAYQLYWTTDSENATIRFGVDVASEGWVGFGFSPNGGMVSADVIMAWIDEDNEVVFSDRFADVESLPRIDASQDFFDIRGARYTVDVDGGLEPSPPTATSPPDDNSTSGGVSVHVAALVTYGIAALYVLCL